MGHICSFIKGFDPRPNKDVGSSEKCDEDLQHNGNDAEQQGNYSHSGSGSGSSKGNGSKGKDSNHCGQNISPNAQECSSKSGSSFLRKRDGNGSLQMVHTKTNLVHTVFIKREKEGRPVVDDIIDSDVDSIYKGGNDNLLAEEIWRENGIEDLTGSQISETLMVDLKGSKLFEVEGEVPAGIQGEESFINSQLGA